VLVQVSIYLIYKVLWPMRKASSGAESSFLPALREVRGGGSRSAGQTLGAGGDLRGANLCDADLSGARLEGANFFKAVLDDADLAGAFLTGAQFLNCAQL